MKITYNNYLEKIGSVDWSKVPAKLQEAKSEMNEFHELYNDDDTIKETFDIFLKQLNEVLAKADVKKIETKNKLKTIKKAANLVILQVRDKQGNYIGVLSHEHDNTKVKMRSMNAYLRMKANEEFGLEFSNTNSATGVTDKNGKPIYVISPNGRNIVKANTKDADYILGNWTSSSIIKKQKPTKKLVEKARKTVGNIEEKKQSPCDEAIEKYVENKKEAREKASAKRKRTKVSNSLDAETVNFYNAEFRLLRRFYNLVSKSTNVSFRSVQLLYMAFQKHSVARKIRKTSDLAALYNICNKKLTKIYEAIAPEKNSAKITFADKDVLEQLHKLVSNKKVDYAISLMNRIINIQGTAPDDKKVVRLLSAIDNAIKKGRIDERSRLFDDLLKSKKDLQKYVDDKIDKIPTKQFGLSGVKKKDKTTQFNKEFKKAIKRGIKDTDGFVLGYPDEILSNYIENYQISLSGKVVRKAIAQTKDHNLNYANFINLPDYLDNPTAIFKSKKKGYVVLTEIKDINNKPVMVALHIDNTLKTSRIASMYVRNNFGTYKKWIEDKLHLFINKKSELFNFQQATIAIGSKNSQDKSTKKNPNNQNKGMNAVEVPAEIVLQVPTVPVKELKDIPVNYETVNPVVGQAEPEKPTKVELKEEVKIKKSNNPFKSSAEKLKEVKAPAKLYHLKNPHLSKFLGKLEIKPKQSLVITLDSGEGGGKTHTCYQVANAFAESGYSPIIWSLEEHESSNLSKDKQRKYFTEETAQIISVESDETELSDQENYNRILQSVKFFDVIIVDSLTKLTELNNKFHLDKDFRKAFNGKLFLLVVQRTADNKMRGGSKTGFDGDVILKVNVDRDDFSKNFIYNHKNRYNDYTPISDLKYSPYHQGLLNDAIETPEEVVLKV